MEERHSQAEGVVQPLCKNQRIAGARKRLVWITEQPPGPGADVSRTDPRIVSVHVCVGPMSLEIVKVMALIGMRGAARRFAPVEVGCPGGVMRLQPESDIVVLSS